MDWRTVSYSVENGNCAEAASAASILVRDTQDRIGVTPAIPAGAWRDFASRLKGDTPFR